METTHDVHLNFPMYVIDSVGGGGWQVEYEGFGCCLLYHTRELAELYASDVRREGGQCSIRVSETPKHLAKGLSILLLHGGTTHVIWDATVRPSGCLLSTIGEVIEACKRADLSSGSDSSDSEPVPPEL